MLYSILLIILAAIANAIMDKVETPIQFKTSRFQNLNPLFWSKVESANNNGFLPGTKYRVDAWHLAKSAWIILFLTAMVIYQPLFIKIEFIKNLTQYNLLNIIVGAICDIAVCGVIYNETFDLFYHNIFYKKSIS